MKKLLVIAFILVLTFTFVACGEKGNKDMQSEKTVIIEAEENNTEQEKEIDSNDDIIKDEKTAEINAQDVFSENIFLTLDKNLHFEYDVTGNGATVHMDVYMTPDFIRADVPIDENIGAVMVFDLKNESAFMYMTDKSFGGEYSNFELYDNWEYQTVLSEYSADITNLKRETLDGREVIYGELSSEGNDMKFWYSEEYGIIMKYVLESAEAGDSTFYVTDVKLMDDVDMTLFEKPSDIPFMDLGELNGTAMDLTSAN